MATVSLTCKHCQSFVGVIIVVLDYSFNPVCQCECILHMCKRDYVSPENPASLKNRGSGEFHIVDLC